MTWSHEALSPRLQQVYDLLVQGRSAMQITTAMGITFWTAKEYIRIVRAKTAAAGINIPRSQPMPKPLHTKKVYKKNSRLYRWLAVLHHYPPADLQIIIETAQRALLPQFVAVPIQDRYVLPDGSTIAFIAPAS